jgi:hypothetical protein
MSLTKPDLDFDYFQARLQPSWRSAVYSFFKPNVKIGYENGRKYHFLPCAARACLNGSHGVRRYLDSKDRATTSNLKTHATRCFGKDAVAAAFKGEPIIERDGSVFAAFARQGQRPVKLSHRNHTDLEIRYNTFPFSQITSEPDCTQCTHCPMGDRKQSGFADCRGP